MGVYLYPSNTETPLSSGYIGELLPTSVTLDKSSINLTTVGQTEQLTATVEPEDAPRKTVTWSSDDTTVATVNTSGLVTCVTPGTCTITATTVNGLTATCSVGAGRLPSAYQEVEWIESNGNQYIDTGFKPNNNSRYLVDYYRYNTVAAPIGCYNNPSTYGFLINNGGPHYGTVADGSIITQTNVRLLCDLNKNLFYVDEVLKKTFTVQTFQMNINAWLFCWNRNGIISNNSQIKIFSAKIYDDGTIVRDFVPCYRIADTVIGMYDVVNDIFYTNQGSGVFTKGPDV